MRRWLAVAGRATGNMAELAGIDQDARARCRTRLAATLAGNAAAGVAEGEAAAWLQCAWEEGVIALLAQRLQADAGAPRELMDALAAQSRGLAMAELAQRGMLVKILAALEAAGIEVLVLKGAALRAWLYPLPWLRESSDLDLLFRDRTSALAAVEALRPLGFAPAYKPGASAHEVLCRHPQLELDLHWALTASPALRHLPAFEVLLADSIPLPRYGGFARGLGPAHALLHACVHRASNLQAGLGDRLKWLYDIHLLAETADEGAWADMVEVSRRARIAGMALDALSMASSLFGTAVPERVREALAQAAPGDDIDAARMADWRYLQWRNLRALPGWMARLRWLWDRLFPPLGYMRESYGW